MNSLAVSVNANTTTATTPGNASGTTARTNAPTRLYPSIIACSSMSRVIDFIKPNSSHTETGMVMVGYTSTSDHVESCSPSATTIRDSDRNSRLGGTRYTRKIATPIQPDHGRSSRARAYAAGSPSSRVIATTSSPSHTVFHTNVRNAVCSNR